jgi:hypothetical protein
MAIVGIVCVGRAGGRVVAALDQHLVDHLQQRLRQALEQLVEQLRSG